MGVGNLVVIEHAKLQSPTLKAVGGDRF